MNKRLVKIICSLFAAVLLLPLFPVSAENATPEIASTAGILYNLEADTFLFEKNSDAHLKPAAFTKLMTALLALEYRAANGNVNVTITEEMLSSAGGTSMKLKVGEVIPFDSLLAGLIVQNANDAALVLASVSGGNISAFVDNMNERAKKLGMEHTYYSNPTGVDSAVMHTTLGDTLLLCKTLYHVNDFMLLSEKAKVTLPATNMTGERVYSNKNALVPYSYVTDYYMKNVRGMVAGYTAGAGYCVATMRQKNNCTNLVLVSGGTDRSEAKNGTDISSYRDAKLLMEWAEEGFSIQNVMEADSIVCEKGVTLAGGVDHMILVAGEGAKVLLPTDADPDKDITKNIRVEEDSFPAPIVKGRVYGELDILFRGEVVATVPLVAQNNIGLSRWLVARDAVIRFFSHGPAKVILICVIVAAILYVVILIGTVWLAARRRNRERDLAIKELNEQENRRLAKVRREERRVARAKLRQAGSFFREGFRVLSGEEEAPPSNGKKNAPQKKAVAKLPEQYRKKKTPPQNSAPKRPQESYRVSRPVPPQRPTQKKEAPMRETYRRSPSPNAHQTQRPIARRQNEPKQNKNRQKWPD